MAYETINSHLILDPEDEIYRHICNWKKYDREIAGCIPGTGSKKVRLRNFILPGSKGYQLRKINGNPLDFRKENICLDKVDKGERANKIRTRNHKRWLDNKEKILESGRIRRSNRTPEQKEAAKIRNRLQKRKQSLKIQNRLADRLRGTFNSALKRNSKKSSAVRNLGCSIDEFMLYMEQKFYSRKNGDEMSWDNYGSEWHIDHIKPLSSFDLSIEENQMTAVHYTNLQPLWKEDNLVKGSRV